MLTSIVFALAIAQGPYDGAPVAPPPVRYGQAPYYGRPIYRVPPQCPRGLKPIYVNHHRICVAPEYRTVHP